MFSPLKHTSTEPGLGGVTEGRRREGGGGTQVGSDVTFDPAMLLLLLCARLSRGGVAACAGQLTGQVCTIR